MTLMFFPTGTFFAFGVGSLYKLPYSQIDIRRFNSGNNLSPPGSYDIGQTLGITVDNTDYLLVLGESEILLYRDDVKNAMLVYETALAYSSSEITDYNRKPVPRRLLKSSRLDGSFFLLSEGGLPVLLELDIYSGVHEIYSSQPISDTVSTSTVAKALGQGYRDDVFVMVVNNSTLRLYSVLDNEYKGTVGVAQHCDQVTRLHNLPPAANDSRISFAMRCTKDGQDMLYYAVVTYRYSQSLDSVHPLNVGVPVATTTYLAVRHGNQVTIFDRSDMDHGVPRSYTASSQVKRVVGFELNSKSYFFAFIQNENVTLIDADLFFNRRPEGTRPIPGTMQGSCDPVCLPYAVVNDGVLLSAQGELNTFDIVALAQDPASSTLTEAARVGGIPDSPVSIDFQADPFAPTPDTTTPELTTASTTDAPTPEETATKATTQASTDTLPTPLEITFPPPVVPGGVSDTNELQINTVALSTSLGTVLLIAICILVVASIGVVWFVSTKRQANRPKDVEASLQETGKGSGELVVKESIPPVEETNLNLQLPFSTEASSGSEQDLGIGTSVTNTPVPRHGVTGGINTSQESESDDASLGSIPNSRAMTPDNELGNN